MSQKIELHIVVDEKGIRSVQIIGPPEVHPEGHDMYFKIRHLIPSLNQEIQKALGNETNFEEGAH
ncbi:MAG TPA: hypothetical protein VHT73_19500 [Thermodesulfobacteriota bacterium]|nr:hypothetical protein [Thermodesulfobacteriota bacterium]